MTTQAPQKKSTLAAIGFEVVFGTLLIVLGILRPAFIWKMDFLHSLLGTLGDLGMRIILVAAGVALIGWTAIKHFILKR